MVNIIEWNTSSFIILLILVDVMDKKVSKIKNAKASGKRFRTIIMTENMQTICKEQAQNWEMLDYKYNTKHVKYRFDDITFYSSLSVDL